MTKEKENCLVTLKAASKWYGKLLALNNVSFELHPGEITAIVGKNGSGKSTLIKILSGVIQADKGEMTLGDNPVHFSAPSDALKSGIVTVHQELSVIPSLTVAENIVMGNWPVGAGPIPKINLKEMDRVAQQILDDLEEGQIDVRALVSSLSIAQRQIIEIARALIRRPKILLLDEPFSTLSAQEVKLLSRRIKAIAQTGLAVAFVTHRLGEIKDIATTVMVLRDGELIIKSPSADVTVERVAQLMLGEVTQEPARDMVKRHRSSNRTEPVLSLRNFNIPKKISGLDLDIYPGEIVGIAGLLGSGRSEFLRSLIGLEPCTYERFTLLNEEIDSPDLRTMIDRGVYFVPEERKLEGFVGQFSIMENLELPIIAKSRFAKRISWNDVKNSAQVIVDKMDIKISDLTESIGNLSGGNQQKIVLGKWIKRGGAKLFLLDEPSRGVDIHARLQIQTVIEDLAGQGVAILMVASDFEELFDICDRLLLIGHGKKPRRVSIGETDLEAVTAELLGA